MDMKEKLVEMSEQLRYCAIVSDCANCKRWDKVCEQECVDNLLLETAELLENVTHGVTVQQWIPVKDIDRLPTENKRVLVYGHRSGEIFKARRRGNKRKGEEMKLKVVLDPGAIMPTRAHSTDAGLDLYSTVRKVIRPGDYVRLDTGVHVAIPEGYVGMLTSKSGLMGNHGITCRGTIDSGYTGTIQPVLFNHSGKTYIVEQGQKITQLVIMPIITPELELVDSLEETERGNGGFGSTGKF